MGAFGVRSVGVVGVTGSDGALALASGSGSGVVILGVGRPLMGVMAGVWL